MKFGDMRVNRFKTPIGVDRQAPLFSFRASQEGIFSVLLYRYGEETPVQECVVGSDESEGFRFRCPLEEAQRYQWSVSDGVQTVTSEFETGVDFHFRGITPTEPTRTAPCFYRAFYVPRELSSARLYLCVPTRHCVFLNGEPMRRMLRRGRVALARERERAVRGAVGSPSAKRCGGADHAGATERQTHYAGERRKLACV